MKTMIALQGVQKVVGKDTVLAIDELRLDAGEAAAIVGSAGSGKAELLSLLTGTSRPTAGSVHIAGLDPYLDRERLSQAIGVLFADNALYERMTVRGNLGFHARLRGVEATRIDEVLSEVGLLDQSAIRTGKLPQGLARRLAFGRAILHQPRILLLTDPFSGCDSTSSALLAQLIRQQSTQKVTVLILATEPIGLVDLCTSIYEIDRGRIVGRSQPRADPETDIPFKIPARQEDQVVLVNPTDLLYATAEEGRTSLRTAHSKIATHYTLSELEERLAQRGFFRAHRGYLVNLQHVKAIIPYTRDSYSLVLDDPQSTEIPLSKAAARDLKSRLGY